MKLLHLSFIIAMGLILIVPSSQAASDLERKLIDSIAIKEKEAINLVENAIDFYMHNGLTDSLKAFSDPKGAFCKKYAYGYEGINIATTEGVLLSSCKYPGLVVHNIMGWTTPDGKLINQIIFKEAKENSYGALIGENITNHNPATGKPSGYRHFARKIGNLVFFAHIYDSARLHKEMFPSEDVKKAQDPHAKLQLF